MTLSASSAAGLQWSVVRLETSIAMAPSHNIVASSCLHHLRRRQQIQRLIGLDVTDTAFELNRLDGLLQCNVYPNLPLNYSDMNRTQQRDWLCVLRPRDHAAQFETSTGYRPTGIELNLLRTLSTHARYLLLSAHLMSQTVSLQQLESLLRIQTDVDATQLQRVFYTASDTETVATSLQHDLSADTL